MKTLISLLLFLSTSIAVNAQNYSLSSQLDFESLSDYEIGDTVRRIQSSDGCYVKFRVGDINSDMGLLYSRYNANSDIGYNSNDQNQTFNISECPMMQGPHFKNRIVGNGYGCHFLSADRVDNIGAARSIFVVFSAPISMVSGEILDIDLNEAWTVIAYEDAASLNVPFDMFTLPVAAGFELDSKGSKFVLSSKNPFTVLEFRLAPGHGTLGGFGLDNLMFCGSCCQ